MSDPIAQATATQLANIEKRTGKTLAELSALLQATGLTKHGALRDWAKEQLGIGAGDANTLTHYFLGNVSAAGVRTLADDPIAALYTGPKVALLPIHEKVMAAVARLGECEIAPKKTYVSLRRKKQFAMLGPATNTRVEVGLNLKGVAGTERLEELPAGGMCTHRVKLTDATAVDDELVGWLRTAYESAG